MRTRTGGNYPHILKVEIPYFLYMSHDGTVTIQVDANCSEALLVVELSRFAMEEYNAVIDQLYQTEADILMCTVDRHWVHMRFLG